ncbi:MAG: hypothetical protein ABFS02_02555 [Pseudomonadota bacterium]
MSRIMTRFYFAAYTDGFSIRFFAQAGKYPRRGRADVLQIGNILNIS